MENSDKISGSLSKRQSQSKCDHEQAWTKLTVKYLKDLPQQLDGIKKILELKDYAAVKKQAHRIKGTSGTYRLDAISKSAGQLECLADSQNSEMIVIAIDNIIRLVESETKRLNLQVNSHNGTLGKDTNV